MTMTDIEYAITRSISTSSKRHRIEELYANGQLTAADRAKALKALYDTGSMSLTFPDGTAGWIDYSKSKGVEARKGAYGTGDVKKMTWAKVEKTIYWMMIDNGGRYLK